MAGKTSAAVVTLATLLGTLALSRPAAAQEEAREEAYLCFMGVAFDADGSNRHVKYAIVSTKVPRDEVQRQWVEIVGRGTRNPSVCTYYDTLEDAQRGFQTARQNYWRQADPVAFNPKDVPPVASDLRRVTVNLASPDPLKGQRGFGGLAFDLEYTFLKCFGELHIAYSVVENSVRPRPDSTLPPAYLLDGKYHIPTARPSQIISVPIRGSVATRQAAAIGKFADDAAAKALGFGCFSGQSKKLGMMKDYLAADATELQVKDFLNSLVAFVETPEVYQFGAAEDEIRTFLREHPEADTLNAGSKQQIARMQRERELAEARAREEAEAAAEAKRLAEERQKAFAEQTARAKAAADKTLAEQKAVEQYQRDKAAHEAELARLAEQKAKYDAEMVEVARKRAEYDKAMEEYRAKIAAGAKPAS